MNFSLLDNAVDSLKSTYESLYEIKELAVGVEHHAKDAILSLNHANELLFKLLLHKNKEYLIFSDINNYMKAKKKMLEEESDSIFEVAPGLQTVSFSEAVKRLEFLCDISVPDSLQKSLMYLNKIRNQIMHFEVKMSRREFQALIEKLQSSYELTVEFFSTYIDELEELVAEARFEMTVDDYFEPDVEGMVEDSYLDWLEGSYEDLGEGKW